MTEKSKVDCHPLSLVFGVLAAVAGGLGVGFGTAASGGKIIVSALATGVTGTCISEGVIACTQPKPEASVTTVESYGRTVNDLEMTVPVVTSL